MNTSFEKGKVTAIWLINGKQIDTTAGYVFTEKGIIVRSGHTGIIVINPSAVISTKIEFEAKEELDKVFNGQNSV